MKILHTADWHLGRRPVGGRGKYSDERYEDYFLAANYIVDKAIENNVDVFLMAGDLFDRNSLLPDMLFRTENILIKLKNRDIPVLLIEGNHDKIYSHDDSWIDYLKNKKLISSPVMSLSDGQYTFEPIVIKGVNFYGVPYRGVLIDETLKALSEILNEKEKNVVIVHTGIGGNFIPGCVEKETIDLFKNKVIYMAGGHLHTFKAYPTNNPYFFVPGCPEYWDLNEKPEKGYIIFDTDTKKYNFFESRKRKLSSYSINYDELEKRLEDIHPENGEIIKLDIVISSNSSIDIAEIENSLLEKGALKVIVRFVYKDIDKDYRDATLVNKEYIEKKLIEKWGDIYSVNSDETVQYLGILKYKIYEDSEILFESFDHFLENIIGGNQDEDK